MDKILIKDIEIFANHGVFKEEKVLGQKFVLSLELSVDIDEAAKVGDLKKTVHYGELVNNVIEMFIEKSIDLIESVCEKIALYVLKNYSLVKGVRVILKKPWAPIGRHLDYVAIDIYRTWNDVFIGLGSNIGNKKENLENAIRFIDNSKYCKVLKKSTFIKTEPWGYLDQEEFINAVIHIKTTLSPKALMSELLNIENIMGRERSIKWGPRTIDLDILFYNDLIMDDEYITIPHPYIEDRKFVLEGLKEICPNKVHPLLGKRIFRI